MKQFSSLEHEQAGGTPDKCEIQMPNKERMTITVGTGTISQCSALSEATLEMRRKNVADPTVP